jgi:hypothetical protein
MSGLSGSKRSICHDLVFALHPGKFAAAKMTAQAPACFLYSYPIKGQKHAVNQSATATLAHPKRRAAL